METAELRLKLSTNGDIMEEKLTFEENMNKLGQVVAQLEKGDIPLEKAVELYGESLKLTALCRRQLDEAKMKITEVGGNEQF